MGETNYYQPLTPQDKITVIIYRVGIVLSTLIVCLTALLVFMGTYRPELVSSAAQVMLVAGVLLLGLYFSVGLSVFFIHLYIGRFHRILKKIYYGAAACLIALFVIGHGNPAAPLLAKPSHSALLLIPLLLCLGFITAKEAFCFRLVEGYILAIIMPAYAFFYAVGLSTRRGNVTALAVVGVLLAFFTVRKVFQPLHYDIGDKSAYQP